MKATENNEKSVAVKDFNRLTIETVSNLCGACNAALKQMQGDDSLEAAMESKPYQDLMQVSLMADARMMRHERKKMKYEKIDRLIDLQKVLYLMLSSFYHYVGTKGYDIPGLHCYINGSYTKFIVELGRCAVNMEHTVHGIDDHQEGTAVAVYLNIGLLLEGQSPEDGECPLSGEYDEFVGFTCKYDAGRGHFAKKDVYLTEDDWRTLDLVRDTLADFDVIADMNAEKAA